MKLLILGPPGAGKGTQAERLAGHFSISHLSAGDLLREAVAEGTKAGKEAEPYMTKGELVPDPLIAKIVGEELQRAAPGFILDGFPRNRAQAEHLDELLAEEDLELDRAISLDVDEETVVRRLKGRYVCSKCGSIYGADNVSRAKRCPVCAGALVQREDDTESTIRNRLRVYREHTHPLLDYYEERGILTVIDGSKSPEEVFEAIIRSLTS